MRCHTSFRLSARLVSLALGTAGGLLLMGRALGEPPAPAKHEIRFPDVAKSAYIEVGTRAVVRTGSAGVPAAKRPANPKVEPGRVRWHGDFAAACDAARKSGKPVLLFQMMGKLDEQFC